LHVSELADHKVEDPHDLVKIGDRIQVKILRVDAVDRKIGLSKKRAEWSAEQDGAAEESVVKPRRGGLHGPGEEVSHLRDVTLKTTPPRTESQAEPESDTKDESTETAAASEESATAPAEDEEGKTEDSAS
jgi:small subunit ribosomal protein S1